MHGIGWVVDDACEPKRRAGGPAEFARALGEADAPPAGHRAACDVCALLDEELACVGVIEPRISALAETWLAGRLPEELDSLPGLLLRKNLEEGAVEGKGASALRARGLMEAPGPFSRHWGPFFRRYTVTTDQILEEMLCAGDVQAPHALGVLLHLGGVIVDGAPPLKPEDGPKLADVVARPETRRERVLCTLVPQEGDDRSLAQLKRYLRGLYAAFVLDCEVRIFA